MSIPTMDHQICRRNWFKDVQLSFENEMLYCIGYSCVCMVIIWIIRFNTHDHKLDVKETIWTKRFLPCKLLPLPKQTSCFQPNNISCQYWIFNARSDQLVMNISGFFLCWSGWVIIKMNLELEQAEAQEDVPEGSGGFQAWQCETTFKYF